MTTIFIYFNMILVCHYSSIIILLSKNTIFTKQCEKYTKPTIETKFELDEYLKVKLCNIIC